MTDHWKDVKPWCDAGRCGWIASWDAVDAARAKDAAERAAREAAYEARVQRDHDEIVELTAEIARLRAQVQQWRDHIDRSAEIENVADLYRRDPLAMADAIVRLREDVGALRAEKD